MNRLINCVLLGGMVAAAVVVYDMKHRVGIASVNVARLETDIEKERESIALLKAEWSYLTRPSRLRELIDRYDMYFELQDVRAEQIAIVSDIPMRPIELRPNRNAPIGGFAGGSDAIVR